MARFLLFEHGASSDFLCSWSSAQLESMPNRPSHNRGFFVKFGTKFSFRVESPGDGDGMRASNRVAAGLDLLGTLGTQGHLSFDYVWKLSWSQPLRVVRHGLSIRPFNTPFGTQLACQRLRSVGRTAVLNNPYIRLPQCTENDGYWKHFTLQFRPEGLGGFFYILTGPSQSVRSLPVRLLQEMIKRASWLQQACRTRDCPGNFVSAVFRSMHACQVGKEETDMLDCDWQEDSMNFLFSFSAGSIVGMCMPAVDLKATSLNTFAAGVVAESFPVHIGTTEQQLML